MPKITENQSGQTDNQEIMFKCKFCGETKPLSEMVLMRQYFPQIAACKSCSRTPITEVEVQTTE